MQEQHGKNTKESKIKEAAGNYNLLFLFYDYEKKYRYGATAFKRSKKNALKQREKQAFFLVLNGATVVLFGATESDFKNLKNIFKSPETPENKGFSSILTKI